MLFGRSVFHSVVERLREEADKADSAETDEAPSSHRVFGLNMSFAAQTAETEQTRMYRSAGAYADILADRPEPHPTLTFTEDEPPTAPEMPAHLTILEPAAIAAELGIDSNTTTAELNEKRRLFARQNHPDCVAAAFRGNATVRMTIANQLIDTALRERQS